MIQEVMFPHVVLVLHPSGLSETISSSRIAACPTFTDPATPASANVQNDPLLPVSLISPHEVVPPTQSTTTIPPDIDADDTLSYRTRSGCVIVLQPGSDLRIIAGGLCGVLHNTCPHLICMIV